MARLQTGLVFLAIILILPLGVAQASGCGTAGAQSCQDAHTVQVCGADGSWTTVACPADNHCSSGACVADCGMPGAYTCADGRTVQVCGADENWQFYRTCGSDQNCQNGQCIVPAAPNSGTAGRIGLPSTGTASSGASGGNVTPYPCVGWTSPIDGPNVTTYETNQDTGQSRNCTNYTLISYCKMTTGEIDTGRTQGGFRMDCTRWSGGADAGQGASAPEVPAASRLNYYPPATSDLQPGQMGWALAAANQYGVFVAIPVGILIVAAIIMVMSIRGKND